MLFVAFCLVLSVLGHVIASGFTDDELVPLMPFIWPKDEPLEAIVKDLESYLEQHVTVAQAGLDLLSVTVDQTAVCESRSPENGTFVVLCRNDELYSLLETMQSIKDRYTHQFCHDWVFLNDEPFDEYFMTGIVLQIPGGIISFGQIPTEQWGPQRGLIGQKLQRSSRLWLPRTCTKQIRTATETCVDITLASFISIHS